MLSPCTSAALLWLLLLACGAHLYVRLSATVKAHYKHQHTEQTAICVLAYICSAIVCSNLSYLSVAIIVIAISIALQDQCTHTIVSTATVAPLTYTVATATRMHVLSLLCCCC
jgi:tetrahydromethanopterin S-methyltransferase subunit C